MKTPWWTIAEDGEVVECESDFRPSENDVDTSIVPVPDGSLFSNTSPHLYELFHTPHGKMYLDEAPNIIKRNLRAGQTWEILTTQAIQRFAVPHSTVIDVGAHNGVHSLTMGDSVGTKGRVYAFEPQLKIYHELWENSIANDMHHIMPLHCAVGDSSYKTTMAGTGYDEVVACLGEGGEEVSVEPIDAFNFQNVSLLKIDVEGHESEVIQGSVETIKREQPVILLEVCGGKNFDTARPWDRAKICSIIRQVEVLGYCVMRMATWDYICYPAPWVLDNKDTIWQTTGG